MSHAYHPHIVDRFHSNYLPVTESGCWLWEGPDNGREPNRRYGRVWIGRLRYIAAHRFSYEIARGQIPKGKHICHTCDTPACVNPDHLFLGTHKENMVDRSRKGRGSRKRTFSKLTPTDVARIRSKVSSGQVTQTDIARAFGVSQSLVSAIKNGLLWRRGDE